MNRLWAITALSLLFLAGCSDSASKGPMDGESVYKESCIACHGTDLKGAIGPPVLDMKSKYSEEELLKIVSEGVGEMPGELIPKEEAQLVTKWLMEK
ncbi:MAG: cytochrome c [Bacillus sp. (in: Bacteria)]|nr:cytochrome c [Bacillus sp. (in: firmicutes)]